MKKLRFWAGIAGGPEGSDQRSTSTRSEQAVPPGESIPMGTFAGYQPPNFSPTLPGAQSQQVDPSPVTIARFNMARGVHDVQLSNGWQRTNYGKRTTYGSSGYLAQIVPTVPGQSRLYGQNGGPASFTPQTQKAIAPSGWNSLVANAQNASVNTVSGPGTFQGSLGFMGQSGG